MGRNKIVHHFALCRDSSDVIRMFHHNDFPHAFPVFDPIFVQELFSRLYFSFCVEDNLGILSVVMMVTAHVGMAFYRASDGHGIVDLPSNTISAPNEQRGATIIRARQNQR